MHELYFLPFTFSCNAWGCTCVNKRIEGILPYDYTQPWNVEAHDILYISSCLAGAVLNKYVLWVSICGPGQFDPSLGWVHTKVKNWGSLNECFKSGTWCQWPDFLPLPLYTTSMKYSWYWGFTWNSPGMYKVSFQTKC